MSDRLTFSVSTNGRYLMANEKPFFFLADTAWNLFHRLTLDEARWFLEKRKEQNFTVIQAVVIAEQEGLSTPNEQGDFIFEDRDPLKPNKAYFDHIEKVISIADELGLVTALLPSWGVYTTRGAWNGPESGKAEDVVLTPENAPAYGTFLAEKFAHHNLIWVLGGDREARFTKDVFIPLAHGIRKIDKEHLMTYHPMGFPFEGGSSATVLHQEPWLDFNMLQSGHQWGHPNYNMIMAERAKYPVKPVLDSEPRYENHPDNFQKDARRMNAWQVRQAAYWALFAGACGHTYGCHDIWQFLSDKRPAVTFADTPWKTAADFAGANQMRHVRAFAENHDWFSFEPCSDLVIVGQEVGDGYVQACREPGKAIFGYIPVAKSIVMECTSLPTVSQVTWFDPTTGKEIVSPISSSDRNVALSTPGKNGDGDEDFVFMIE